MQNVELTNDRLSLTVKFGGVLLRGPKGDPGVGIPPGGAAGQVLMKVSDTDYDTDWQTPTDLKKQIEALDGLLKNVAYTKDVTTEYAAFRAAFGLSGGDEHGTKTWSVTSVLTNATSSNGATSVADGSSYSATITAEEGYTLSSFTVMMGGVDITDTAYTDGVITIAAVTGNVIITVNASATSGEALVTNGLQAYFDFRTAEYNNDATGGATTISPTSGNGSLFAWEKKQHCNAGRSRNPHS